MEPGFYVQVRYLGGHPLMAQWNNLAQSQGPMTEQEAWLLHEHLVPRAGSEAEYRVIEVTVAEYRGVG